MFNLKLFNLCKNLFGRHPNIRGPTAVLVQVIGNALCKSLDKRSDAFGIEIKQISIVFPHQLTKVGINLGMAVRPKMAAPTVCTRRQLSVSLPRSRDVSMGTKQNSKS